MIYVKKEKQNTFLISPIGKNRIFNFRIFANLKIEKE
jgi:hypothetical protein